MNRFGKELTESRLGKSRWNRLLKRFLGEGLFAGYIAEETHRKFYLANKIRKNL